MDKKDDFDEEELEHMRKIIKLTLIRIGIRCDLTGFNYLCYAVELVIKNPNLIHNLCKGLYVAVGEYFNVNKTSSVERSIRHAMENTALSKSYAVLNKMFKTMLYAVDDRPTAGELIRLVAEYYNLELYKDDNLFN